MLIPLNRMVVNYNLQITGILHVGAHVGEEAESYETCGVRNVLWIEGNPDLMSTLRAHVIPYGHRAVLALVSDGHDDVTFYVTNNFESSSILEMGTHKVVSPDVHVFEHKKLSTVRLDWLADHHDFTGLNFLNMDLQGAELLALRGLGDLIKQFDYIYTEVNVDELYIDCVRLPELDTFLHSQSFRRVEIAMAGDAGWGDALYVRV